MADLRIGTLLMLIGLAAVLTGCKASLEGSHPEHHAPAHKPKSFAKAVDQLELRDPFRSPGSEQSGRSAQQAELLDIVRWLPELAAETDLRRPDWDVVQRASLDLEQLVANGRESDAARTAAGPRYQEAVGILRELLSRTGPELPTDNDSETGD